MSTKNERHTPGVWTVDPDTDGRGRGYIRCDKRLGGTKGIAVARVMSTGHARSVEDANARLIASAPDLLAALEQIERLSREADRALVDVPAMLGDIARAALCKARGES